MTKQVGYLDLIGLAGWKSASTPEQPRSIDALVASWPEPSDNGVKGLALDPEGTSKVESWTVQLLTILGVAVGAAGSFFSAQLLERSKWQREEAHRWDSKRLETYAQFANSVKDVVIASRRIAAGLGLPGTAQPLDAVVGLPLLANAVQDLSVKWEHLLMLGSPEVIGAARDWRHAAWHLEWFARGLRDGAEEYFQAEVDSRIARRCFYAAVRADLGIVSGAIPGIDEPAPWGQIGDQQSEPVRNVTEG